MFIKLFNSLSEVVRNRGISHLTEEEWKEVILWVEQIKEILRIYDISPLQAFTLLDISKTGESYTDTSSILKRVKGKFPALSLSINKITDECTTLLKRVEPLIDKYSAKKDELCLRPTAKGKDVARQLMEVFGDVLLPNLSEYDSILESLEKSMSDNFLKLEKGQKFNVSILGYPKRGRRREIEISIVKVTVSSKICKHTGLNECFVLFNWNCLQAHKASNHSCVSYTAQNAYHVDVLIGCSDPECKFRVKLTPALRYSAWRYFPKDYSGLRLKNS